MSASTSSPSVHPHPISPSSSHSSTDSAPHSEPTSDEQPDLGAFTTVLREWTHLQPPPRIPVQIHSATSSTTPTYQPEQSVAGSDVRVRSGPSRFSNSNRSRFSDVSSFTRPPSSSVHPEGSTVWNQALIASYLASTPSNDVLSEREEEEEEEEEEEYTPSPPNSLVSTALTVEIASETDYPSYDESSHEAHPNASPYNGVFLAIPVGSDGQRLDSRETAHRDDEVEGISSTRDYVDSQITSMQLQSQAREPTTSMSGSLSIPTVQTGLPSTASLSNTDHTPASNPSTSTSTLITALLNRSRNPVPPRTTSDSSYTTTDSAASSSNLSLLSYQIPETPPIEEEEEEDEQVVTQPPVTHFSSSGHSNPSASMSSGSGSLSFKSQRSITSHSPSASASTSTLATQRQPLSQSQSTQPRLQPQPHTQQKLQTQQPLRSSLASSVFSNESPLFNPHSPLPAPQPAQRHSQHPLNVGLTSIGFGVVDDLGTPDQPPSETLPYEASAATKQKQRDMLMEFIPVDDLDVEDEVDNSFGRNTQSLGYYSGNKRTNIGTSSLGGPSSSSSTFERQPATTDTYSQSQSRDHPRIHSEAAYVDDRVADGQGQGEEDHYPYRYSYENAYKSYSQAMTPKGIPRTDNRAPPSQVHPQAQDVLRQLETSTATAVPQSQSYVPTGKHDHFAYHDQESSSAQKTSTQSHSQHDSIAQPMTTTTTNEALPPLSHELATHAQQQQQLTSQPQSLPPSHSASSYTFSVQQQSYGMMDSSNTRRLPPAPAPAPASSSTHNNNNNINTISAYSSQYSQTQPQTSISISKKREMYQELSHPQPQHRYPHSLLGLHALPASFVSPPAQDLPVVPDLDATTSALEAQSLSLSGTAPVSIPATTVRDKGKSRDAPGMTGTTSTSGDDPRPLIVEADFGEPEPSEEQRLRSGVASHLPTAYDSRPGLLDHGHEYGQGHGYMSEEEQSLPSLGYLDEALSFIAAERARWSAAREGPSANGSGGGAGGGGGVGDPTDSREVGGGEGGLVRDREGGNDKGGGSGGGGKNKQVVSSDNEPKRRRRRKRPPRAHATPQVIPAAATASSSADNTNYSHFPPPPSSAPAMTTRNSEGAFDDSFITPLTPGASPRKKKRSTSVAASASSSKRSLLPESPSKSKIKGKAIEKEFLVLPQAPVTILRRPGPTNDAEGKGRGFSDDEEEDASMLWEGDSDGGGDGGKTPTNALQGRAVEGPSSDGLQPINYTGRRGRRVGRRERERERQKREFMKQEEAGEKDASGDEDAKVGEVESESDDHDDDGAEPHEDEEREGEGEGEEDDDQAETDSLSNLTLLKPPRKNRSRSRRRRGRDRAYIHDMAGISISGVYKSTPGTPRRLKFDDGDPVDGMEEEAGVQAPVEVEAAAANDSFVSNPTPALGRQAGEKKKRTRSKRVKALTRAKSDPELRLDVEGGASAPVGEESGDVGPRKSRKGKNKAQADDSMDILDMDRSQLQRLIFASSGAGSRLLLANQQRLLNNQNRVPPPPHSKRGRLLNLANQLFQLFPEQHRELGSIISRIEGQGVEAWPPKGHRTLRSNITIDPYGMQGSTASPLRRKKSKKGGHIRTGSEGAGGGGESFEFDMESFEVEEQSNNSFRFPGIDEEDENDAEIDPRGLAPKKGDVLIHVFIDHSNILIGLLSHLKRHAPLRKITGRGQPASAVLSKTTTTSVATENLDAMSAFAAVKSTSARPLPVPTTGEAVSSQRQPVPVPKGGKHPIPLPSFATMSRSLPVASVLKSNGTGSGQEGVGANSDGNDNSTSNDNQEESAGPTSLFVGSIKKEKKIQKHLWHSALALILERGRPITRRVVVTSSPLYQPMESMVNLGYELRIFIRVPDLGDGMDRERHRDKGNTAKGAQSSPVAIPGNNLSGKKTHERQVSGSTSTESGSGGAGSGHASGGGGNTIHDYTGMVNNSAAQTKVKYREQGVDELLQLKLHQAIAATDVPPLGSTIVLATGDGNMGQFNEDGFLGPIRLALRRGWRVELYAWEDGLSRAWRREFGAGTEWGRTGMFRVIGMEQFASTLVEAPEWS